MQGNVGFCLMRTALFCDVFNNGRFQTDVAHLVFTFQGAGKGTNPNVSLVYQDGCTMQTSHL